MPHRPLRHPHALGLQHAQVHVAKQGLETTNEKLDLPLRIVFPSLVSFGELPSTAPGLHSGQDVDGELLGVGSHLLESCPLPSGRFRKLVLDF